VKISEIDMTPALAAKLLEKNTRNRKASRVRVTTLTAAIDRDEWVFDGNPIKIASSGIVLDGQHRLMAIAAGTRTVRVILIEGLDEDAQMVMDAGKPRSFADYLHIHGVQNSLNMAAAVRLVWNYQNDLFGPWHKDWFARPMPTNAQLWDVFKTRQVELELGVMQSSPVCRVVRMSRAVASGAWVVLGGIECDKCSPVGPDLDEFYEMLSMRKATEFDGIGLFIKTMNGKDRDKKSTLVAGYAQHVQFALLIKAWNAYREGRPVAQLKYTLGGARPEKFPTPH
jgi:hypothetical protein